MNMRSVVETCPLITVMVGALILGLALMLAGMAAETAGLLHILV